MSNLHLTMDLDPNSETQMRALASFADILASGHCISMKMRPIEEKMLEDALKHPEPDRVLAAFTEPQSQYTAEELAVKAEAPKRARASRSKAETPIVKLEVPEGEELNEDLAAEEAIAGAVDPVTENEDTNANEEPEVTTDMVRDRFGEKAKADQDVKVKVRTWISGKGAANLDSLGKEHLPALLKYINSL